MTNDLEIKYHKFFLDAGQQLSDLPAVHRLKKNGWQVTWSYAQNNDQGIYVETLLQRSLAKQRQAEIK